MITSYIIFYVIHCSVSRVRLIAGILECLYLLRKRFSQKFYSPSLITNSYPFLFSYLGCQQFGQFLDTSISKKSVVSQ